MITGIFKIYLKQRGEKNLSDKFLQFLHLAMLWCFLFTPPPHTHTPTSGFTVQGQDASRKGSSSGASCPEPERLQRGHSSVSTCRRSTVDSPGVQKLLPTPASDQSSSGAVLAQHGAGSAGTLADDVFSTADEVFTGPDSPQKEFHSAVLRALTKEATVVEAAAGTADEAFRVVAYCGLRFSLLPCSVLVHVTTHCCTGSLGFPACCVLFFFLGARGVCCCLLMFFLMMCNHPPYSFQISKPLLDYFPTPCCWCVVQRYQSCDAPDTFLQFDWTSSWGERMWGPSPLFQDTRASGQWETPLKCVGVTLTFIDAVSNQSVPSVDINSGVVLLLSR